MYGSVYVYAYVYVHDKQAKNLEDTKNVLVHCHGVVVPEFPELKSKI